ncbi:uncharacterized protein BDV14DRAFT_199827 [Aspergillus stella-maris]|uniref:uncharacterized protein n=1 Tax=Aspergillus stella-maris TaxID=1810926 RepID=UPI003CCD1BF6
MPECHVFLSRPFVQADQAPAASRARNQFLLRTTSPDQHLAEGHLPCRRKLSRSLDEERRVALTFRIWMGYSRWMVIISTSTTVRFTQAPGPCVSHRRSHWKRDPFVHTTNHWLTDVTDRAGSSDSSYAAHSPRSDENALGFDYGTAPALDLDNIVGAPDWLDAFCCSSQSQSPSIAPNPVGSQAQSHLHPQQCPPSQLHPTTNSNNDGFPAGLAGPQSVSASSASSAPSAVSASVSTASSVAGVPAPTVDFYRLSELSLTLHEYCQRAQTYAQSSADAMVPPPTIDQVLAVTQSLTDVLAPFSTSLSADAYTTTSSPRSNHVHGVNDPLRASLDYSQNHHLPLPPRSAPDAATTLLILSCYLRLLDLYNTILLNANPTPGHCSPPGTLPLPMPGSMTGPGQGQAHQPLHLQIGCFSTPMASSTALLTFLSSQLLGNLETSLSALASSPQLGPSKAAAAISRVGSQSSLSNAASEYGFGSCASAGGGGPASSVMFLTNAAVMEAKSLRRNLKSQFQGLSPAFWGE